MGKKMTLSTATEIVNHVQAQTFPSSAGVVPANKRLKTFCSQFTSLLSEGDAWGGAAEALAGRLGLGLTVTAAHTAISQEEVNFLSRVGEAFAVVKGTAVASNEYNGPDPIPGMAARRALWDELVARGATESGLRAANSLLYKLVKGTTGSDWSLRRKVVSVLRLLPVEPTGLTLPEATPEAEVKASAKAEAPKAKAPEAKAPEASVDDLADKLFRRFRHAPDVDVDVDCDSVVRNVEAVAPTTTSTAPTTAPTTMMMTASEDKMTRMARSLRAAGFSAEEVAKALLTLA